MKLKDKKIYFILSPHINYYHSYRGDSRGKSGFGKDLKLMRGILDKLDEIEDQGFDFGDMKITWDYADTFWSIQLQQEYQQDVLDRVIERCKQGKDEVLIGSWANVAQPILDTEEFLTQHNWFLENEMGIGVNQLFKGRVAPYARTQETMFTQGMIELYNKVGVEGIALYYSVYPFDVSRPFIKPRLNWSQRYGLVKLNSTVSDASMLMIPTYAFGDILDFCSIKRWFELIREKQKDGEIAGHALLFLNFDMDYDNWVGMKLPKFLQWMPNSRGLSEFAEAVDLYDYVEFGNLLEVIPKLEVHGETVLKQDVADGLWNGYYNWAQKYSNTKFWTIGQQARWLKCIADTIKIINPDANLKQAVNTHIRDSSDLSESYIKNKLLFASTTNFGMSMPFQHPDRRKTALNYGVKAFQAAEASIDSALTHKLDLISNNVSEENPFLFVLPITNRGKSKKEYTPLTSDLIVRTQIDQDIIKQFELESAYLDFKDYNIKLRIYDTQGSKALLDLKIEEGVLKEKKELLISDIKSASKLVPSNKQENKLKATSSVIENEYLSIRLSKNGTIQSFQYKRKDFACPNFLETAVTFGKREKGKRFSAESNKINLLSDGSDGFSASVEIISNFEIIPKVVVKAKKVLTLYSELPYLFVNVKVKIPEIKGDTTSVDGTQYVAEQYDPRWLEIMPCEIKPRILGKELPLRIWKRNFFGVVSYFDTDLHEIDPENYDLDCLVSNVSDGWMAVSNRKKGMLVGFNSIKAANFAFSPLKVKGEGFGDCRGKAQQLRINPFGTYFGKMFHYWTEGTGHAQEIIPQMFGTFHSTAPTFSGKSISFDLIIIPYVGDRPSETIQSFADHFSLPPLIALGTKKKPKLFNNFEGLNSDIEKVIQDNNLEELFDLSYIQWVRKVNESFDPKEDEKLPGTKLNLKLKTLLRLLIDGIKGR
ncbi:MAG: hypothetical protein BAJALOKI2v1_20071 [Promethearchaeota archaeon]|nr:MAG: hypothetical protein BAJALOKI2v1_20071 [Candidatus Lokiarchaeota archaeon]